MLGTIPIPRRSKYTVLGAHVYNLVLLVPFVIAFQILTHANDGSHRTCFGIPWDAAKFARWAFFGLAVYQIMTIRFNLMVVRIRRKKHHESKLTPWLRMFDTLSWLVNWSVFFYLVTGLVHRSQCHSNSINALLWATVIISAVFALAQLVLLTISLVKFFNKLRKEILEEPTEQIATREPLEHQRKQGAVVGTGTAADIMGIHGSKSTSRKTNITGIPRDQLYIINGRAGRNEIIDRPSDLGHEDQVIDKGQEARTVDEDRALGVKKDVGGDKMGRERADEVINIREETKDDGGDQRISRDSNADYIPNYQPNSQN